MSAAPTTERTKEQVFNEAELHIAARHRTLDKLDPKRCDQCRQIKADFASAPSESSPPLGDEPTVPLDRARMTGEAR